MRISRSALLARWRDAPEARAVLLEAPAGFGKSWLVRRLVPRGTLVRRRTLGPPDASDDWLVIDDAHFLTDDEVDELTAIVEDGLRPVAIATRLAPERLRRAVQLADGLDLGVADLALSATDIVEAVEASGTPAVAAALGDEVIERILAVTDGEIAIISATLDELVDRTSTDPVLSALQQRRAAIAALLRGLDPVDRSLVGALARVPALDGSVIERVGGPDAITRLVAAGAPLQRLPGGLFALSRAGDNAVMLAYAQASVDPAIARELAADLLGRGETVAAVTLLLDAGLSAQAVDALASIEDSDAEAMGADTLLLLLNRLGAVVERDPRLLLLRAHGSGLLGREAVATADVERAAELVAADPAASDGPVARRVAAYLGLRLAFADRRDEALAAAERALTGIGPGEDATLARAHMVRATLAQSQDSREGLQLAAEEYRLAALAWEAAGQHVNARFCRSDLAMAALCPLGRFDEALSTLADLLSAPDVADAERSWYLLNEGFALVHANRLDRASARFSRVMDLSRVQNNPRLAAAAAWGKALVAECQGDLPETLRWLTQAENTALGEEDSTLGVPFFADAAVALGALGADDLAERYFRRAESREGVYYSYVERARFIVNARAGVVGDRRSVEEHIASTPPWEWWRLLLVAADAVARRGEMELAAEWLRRAEYELLGLGLSDFEAVGEGRTADRLRRALAGASERATGADADGDGAAGAVSPTGQSETRRAAPSADSTRLCVFGATMTVVRTTAAGEQTIEVPPGNPQRLVGVVVANGGVATFDQLSDALWEGEELATTRARLRNVLMRLRRAVGEIVVRTPNGVRLAPDVHCDLVEFDRLASDALTYLRSDPDLAGQMAEQALEIASGPLLSDFEYDEWALVVRRRTEQQLLALLDLLSVQAQDEGDLGRAQQLAERALRLDRYTDSRYVRLADLLTLDGRVAAAIAVLGEATDVAGELGGSASEEVQRRRAQLGKRDASGA